MDKGLHGRRDRLVKDPRHDTYKERGKCGKHTVCKGCGATFVKGRWSWQQAPAEYIEKMCPACQRIADDYPAGVVEISGDFFNRHRGEMINLIHNAEKIAKRAHPLERIMTIANHPDHAVIRTTGVHLARRIGENLTRAYQGNLDFRYGEAEKSIRVMWQRQ